MTTVAAVATIGTLGTSDPFGGVPTQVMVVDVGAGVLLQPLMLPAQVPDPPSSPVHVPLID